MLKTERHGFRKEYRISARQLSPAGRQNLAFRSHLGSPSRGDAGAAREKRLRQNHDNETDQPSDRPYGRTSESGWQTHFGMGSDSAPPPHRLRDPGSRFVSPFERRRKYRRGSTPGRMGGGADQGACPRVTGHGRSRSRAIRHAFPRGAIGGPATKSRSGPGPGRGSP